MVRLGFCLVFARAKLVAKDCRRGEQSSAPDRPTEEFAAAATPGASGRIIFRGNFARIHISLVESDLAHYMAKAVLSRHRRESVLFLVPLRMP